MEDKQKFLKENEAREKKGNSLIYLELLHQKSDIDNLPMSIRTLLRSNSAVDEDKKEEFDPYKPNKDNVSPTISILQQRIKLNLHRTTSLLTFVRDQNKSDDISIYEQEADKKDGDSSLIEDLPSRVKIKNKPNSTLNALF